MRKLGQYGYDSDEIRQLFRLVDWVMKLPEDLEPVFEQTLQALSQESEMTYVSTIDRWVIRKSQEGRANMLLAQIQHRFGLIPEDATQRIRTAPSEQLELWALNFVDAATLDGVFRD